jgi:signal transduction histidine kinase/ActR/RegA family two-component response regulator
MAEEYTQDAPTRDFLRVVSTMVVTQNTRYWLVMGWSFALAYAAGWGAMMFWTPAAIITSLIRGELEQRLAKGASTRPGLMLSITAIANSLLWSLPPWMIWQAGKPGCAVITIAMLLSGYIFVFTQFGHRLRRSAIITTPYTLVAIACALSMPTPQAFWPLALAGLILCSALAANVLFTRVYRVQIANYEKRQAALIKALEEARDSANAANAAKSAFLATVSHELRTPMNGVLGAAQLLDVASLTKAQKRYVEMIRSSGGALLGLLNDILDFAKIEAGHLEVQSIDFDLPDVVGQVAAVWSAKAGTKGLDCVIDIDEDAPVSIVGDPTRLSQILHNLLSNAVKFTDAGAVTLTLRAEPNGAERARIVLCVVDTGAGIAPEDLPRLFQPFTQLDSSSTRRHGGTGLGLVICRRLAELIGGGVEVASQPGEGTTFTLTFDAPVSAWSRSDAADAVEEPLAAEPRARALRVLLVEDHPINRKLLVLWLEMEGHAYACAEDGQVALSLCATQAFDVILMDVNMPVMDGLTAVRALRRGASANRETPVVMLTAAARAEDHAEGLAAGADAYLTKPIDFVALRQTLERIGGDRDDASADWAAA